MAFNDMNGIVPGKMKTVGTKFQTEPPYIARTKTH